MWWVFVGFIIGATLVWTFVRPRSTSDYDEPPEGTPTLQGTWAQIEASVNGDVRLRFVAPIGVSIELPVEPLLAGTSGPSRLWIRVDPSGRVITPPGQLDEDDERITWSDGPLTITLQGHSQRPQVTRVAPFQAPSWTPPMPAIDEQQACDGDNEAKAEGFGLDSAPPAVCGLMEEAEPFGSDGTSDGLMGVADGHGNLVMYWAGHDPFGIWFHTHSLAEFEARGFEEPTPGGDIIYAMPACYLSGTPEEEESLSEHGAHWVADFRGAERGACYDEGVPVGDIGGRILLLEPH